MGLIGRKEREMVTSILVTILVLLLLGIYHGLREGDRWAQIPELKTVYLVHPFYFHLCKEKLTEIPVILARSLGCGKLTFAPDQRLGM
jgi:hypothetical protein